MRKKMVEEDWVEAVIGLGPNLFYNSPMEAMILIGNSNKSKNRKGKVLFVNGKNDVVENKGLAYLTETHINKLFNAYKTFSDIPFFAKVATIEEILTNGGNMNVNLYVKAEKQSEELSFEEVYANWEKSNADLKVSMNQLFETLG